ncbi:MAG: hypothetical protein LUG21_04535 [Clostridiales bacterium]|nr:hypothetical protein [Clostridiales bacterium]
MSYLLAKRFEEAGCIALKVNLGNELSDYVCDLEEKLDSDIEIVVISNPEVYGEYKPYKYVQNYDEFAKEASKL